MSYSVVKGDFLWGIYTRNKAKGNTSSWEDYKKANPEFANGQTMHEGDSVTIPSKTIPDDAFDESKEKVEAKEEPVEQNKTSDEKAEEAVEETKNESSKNSEATDCCCMVAPWMIQQENRNYVLDMTELYRNPDRSKTARELVSKDQEKKEHKLYVIAPPKKDDEMQFKKINVTYEFMRKKQKCELVMLAKSEKYRESVNIQNFFEINSLGRIKNAQHSKSDKIEEPNFPHKSIDGVGSRSYQYRIKKEELDTLYKEYEQEQKPFWKNYLL